MSDDGERLRRARERAALTQREVAEATGVKQSNIAAYERGRRIPSAAMLARLLEATRPKPSVALAAHRAEVLAVARAHHATDVHVFGSVARGEDHSGSDLDLLVSFTGEASLLDHAALVEDLEQLLGVSVDVLSKRALRERDQTIRAQAVPL